MASSHRSSRSLTRRQLLGAAAVSAASLTPAAALAGSSSVRPGASAASAAQAAPADTLNLHIELTPPTLWPVVATDRSSGMVFELVYSTLVRKAQDLSTEPQLAESLEASPDATVYTVTLREGLRWHDGQPVTTADVEFTFGLHLHQQGGSFQYGVLSTIAGAAEYYDGTADEVTGIEVVDDRTITFTLTGPNGAFPTALWGIWILPQHIYGDIPVDQLSSSPTAQTPVGTGPYKFVRYETDQFYEFAANEEYYLGAPAIPKAFMKIATADVGLVMLERGEVDFIVDLPPADLARVEGLESVEVLSIANQTWPWALVVNRQKPYFQDVRVLKALMHGLNRQAYVDSILLGQGVVLNHLVGPGWAWAPEDQIEQYPYDPDMAKALLAEAEWDSEQVVQVIFYPGNKSRDQMAIIAQQQWKEIGFEVDVVSMDVARFVERWQGGSDYEIGVTGGGAGDPETNRTNFYGGMAFPGGNNNVHYSNPRVDELFDQGKVAASQEERAAIYQEMDVILNDELPWLPVCLPNYVSAISARVQNVTYDPNVGRYWRIHEWTIGG